MTLPTQPDLDAWDCLLVWHNLSEEEAAKHPKLYKGRCKKLLSQVFDVGPRACEKWGMRFEKMPESKLKTLRVWLFARMITRSFQLLDDESRALIMEPLSELNSKNQ